MTVTPMNSAETGLLELIRKSLFGFDSTGPVDCDYYAVLKEAKQQTVLGLVFQYIPDLVLSQDSEWKHIAEQQTAFFLQYLHEQDLVKHILDDANIPFVVIKGCASAIYYPDPSKRNMGDIDLLVRKEDYDRAKEILFAEGYCSNQKENIRNITLKKHRIAIELHRQFSSIDKDLESYVVDGMRNSEIRNIDGCVFPMLPKLANGIVLLDHMRQHLKVGLGLRQVIDWMMYVNTELDDAFWNAEFKSVAKDTGLEKLALVATQMCKKYLGLSERITWCLSADEGICDELINNLFDSGNFGIKRGEGKKIEVISSSFKKEGVIYRLQKSGEKNWKLYSQHRWLKPFCWIYQVFRYMWQGVKTKRNLRLISEDIKRGQERVALLKKLGID